MQDKHVTLSIDSRLENVVLVGTAVHRLCETAGLKGQDACWVELCVVEAVNNSIEHAYQGNRNQRIEVTFTIMSDRLKIEVSDQGVTMHPSKLEAALDGLSQFDPSDLETLPHGGMGLGIIHKLMDQVEYRSTEGKNTLTMVKRLTANSEQQ